MVIIITVNGSTGNDGAIKACFYCKINHGIKNS